MCMFGIWTTFTQVVAHRYDNGLVIPGNDIDFMNKHARGRNIPWNW